MVTERGWHAELAWLGDGVAANVLIEARGERLTAVTPGVPAPEGATRLAGLTLPGLANAHSHAFHRALRGRAQAASGTFWTWREQMYEVAARLDPDSYHRLARAVYGEMALAGISCVGEFHYLHHGPGGVRYADPNAMGEALIAAAADAGIRITLLDACYLTGGIDRPLEGPQLRFGDGSATEWARRVTALHDRMGGTDTARDVAGPTGVPPDGPVGRSPSHARIGAAIHSVRAVPPGGLHTVAGWARDRGLPLHVHLSEQPAENEDCLRAYGRSPARLLADHGALGAATVAVHATHVSGEDVALLGGTGTGVCMCPTTERDLADGVGPARRLRKAGSPLCLGSDQHAVIDLFEEARGVELDERLVTRRRGHWRAGELLAAATAGGHRALGRPEAGRLEPGACADLVTVSLNSVRLAGTKRSNALESVVFAATAADVRHVVVSGREIVRDGHHRLIEDVPRALTEAIDGVFARE